MSFSLPRNPDGDVSPWCYVAEHEDGVYWKYCEIPTCQSKAVTPPGPRALSFRSGGQCPGGGGRQCRRWEEKPPGLKMLFLSWRLFGKETLRFSQDPLPSMDKPRTSPSTGFPHTDSFMGRDGTSLVAVQKKKQYLALWGINFQKWGNSLAVQWLGLSTVTAGAWVQSLIGKWRSHGVWPIFFFFKNERRVFYWQ